MTSITFLPSIAFVEGGTLISIVGQQFLGVSLDKAILNDTVAIIKNNSFVLPQMHRTGMYKVGLYSQNSSEAIQISDLFLLSLPIVDKVIPLLSSASSSQSITIIGRGMHEKLTLYCSFLKKNARSVHLTSSMTSCLIHGISNTSTIDITIKISENRLLFEHQLRILELSQLPRINPSSGPFQGGFWVTILGNLLENAGEVQCLFGRNKTASLMDLQIKSCKVPSSSIGNSTISLSIDHGLAVFSDLHIEFLPMPQVLLISPSVGIKGHTQKVTITLSSVLHRQDHVACGLVNSFSVISNFNGIDGTELECMFPASNVVGSFQFFLEIEGERIQSNKNFTYLDLPKVQSVIFNKKDRRLEFLGQGIHNDSLVQCLLDEEMFPGQPIAPSSIFCNIPPRLKLQVFVLIYNGVELYRDDLSAFGMSQKIFSILPSISLATTSSFLTVRGENLNSYLSIHITSKELPYSVSLHADLLSTSLIQVKLPALDPGRYAITIWNRLFQNLVGKNEFSEILHEVKMIPTVFTIQPTKMYSRSSVTISVRGQGFSFKSCICSFENYDLYAHNVTFTLVLCDTPSLTSSKVQLHLNCSEDQENHFYFLAGVLQIHDPPIILLIIPNAGPSNTDFWIEIVGANFVHDSTCNEGSTKLMTQYLSSTRLQCFLPSHAEGTSTFGVDFYNPSSMFLFHFHKQPILMSVIPSSILTNTYTSITLIGRHFQNQGAVLISSSRFGMTYVSSTRITSSIIVERPGFLEFSLSINEVTSSNLMSLEALPSNPIYFHPSLGPIFGGLKITVHGNFLAWPDIQCSFGRESVAAYRRPTELHCTLPAVPLPGPKSVALSFGHSRIEAKNAFMYYSQVKITRIFPSTLPARGGTPITIHSSEAFQTELILKVIFDSSIARIAKFAGSNEALVSSPSLPLNKQVVIQLTYDQIHFSNSAIITTSSPAFVKQIVPTIAASSKGVLVTIHGVHFIETCCLHLGRSQCKNVIWLSSTLLKATVDAVMDSGNHTVQVSNDCSFNMDLENSVSLLVDRTMALVQEEMSPSGSALFPEVNAIKPSILGINARTIVTVFGKNFPTSQVLLKSPGSRAKHIQTSNNSITFVMFCTRLGENGLALCFDHVNCLQGIITTLCIPVPTLVSINPIAPKQFHNAITIVGNSFQFLLPKCFFGSFEANASVVDSEMIICKTPPNLEGNYTISLLDFAGRILSTNVTSLSSTEIDFLSIEPACIQANDTTKVTITGRNFDSDCSSCSISATSFDAFVHNRQKITCPIKNVNEGIHEVSIVCANRIFPTRFSVRIANNCQRPSLDASPKILPRIIGKSVSINLTSEESLWYAKTKTKNITCQWEAEQTVGYYRLPNELICAVPLLPVGNAKCTIFLNNSTYFGDFKIEVFQPPVLQYLETHDRAAGWFAIKVSNMSCQNSFEFHLGFTQIHLCTCTSDTVKCPWPNSLTSENQTFRLTHEQQTITELLISLPIGMTLNVQKINPSVGPSAGGSAISFVVDDQGLPFRGNVACEINDLIIPGSLAQPDVVQCFLPPLTSGVVNIAVHIGYHHSKSLEFLVYDPMNISSLRPSEGPRATKTSITILGSSFIREVGLACWFDQASLSEPAHVLTSTMLTCSAPGMHVGVVQVAIKSADNRVHGETMQYSLKPVPHIRRVQPTVSESIADRITLIGEGFDGSLLVYCRFGFQQSRSRSSPRSASVVVCDRPPDALGNMSLTLESEDSSHRSMQYTILFQAQKHVFAAQPSFADVRGGTAVHVTGIFSPHTSIECLFGQHRVKSLLLSSTQVRCTAPPHDAGEVCLDLLIENKRSSVTRSFAFLQVGVPEISAVVPQHVLSNRGGVVTVHGQNFLPGLSACDVAGVRSEVIGDSRSIVTCNLGPQLRGKYELSIYTPTTDTFSNKVLIWYEAAPTVSGYVEGIIRSSITVTGSHFLSTKDLLCRFNNSSPDFGKWLSSTQVKCSIVGRHEGPTMLSISMFGLDDCVGSVVFEAVARSAAISIYPTIGPLGGGTRIEVFGSNIARRHAFCWFGQLAVEAEVVGSQTAYCTTRAVMSPRAFRFGIGEEPEGEDSVSPVFEFAMSPSVSNIHPSRRPRVDNVIVE
eukprot:764841-Hanusia_phi.AAC.1